MMDRLIKITDDKITIRGLAIKKPDGHMEQWITIPMQGDTNAMLRNDILLCAFRALSAYEDTGLTPDEVEALKAENARLRAELEAAKRDIHRECETCKFADCPANVPPCEKCGGYHDEFLGASGWEWRGATENGGANGRVD